MAAAAATLSLLSGATPIRYDLREERSALAAHTGICAGGRDIPTATVQRLHVDKSDVVHRTYVRYIERTREFYAAEGYERPYRWAQFSDVPFAALEKPLSDCRVTLVTTANPFADRACQHEVSRKEMWSGPAARPPDRLYTDHLTWDKEATHTDDVESFLPLGHLQAFQESGRIGAVATRFHGVPTDYSQRRTIEQDAPEILRRCRDDGVDVALLVPL